jgi:hypothetical protein
MLLAGICSGEVLEMRNRWFGGVIGRSLDFGFGFLRNVWEGWVY